MTRRYLIDSAEADRHEVRDALGSGRLDELFTALLNHRPTEGRCPHCGFAASDIERSGLTGCPLCYVVHEAMLLQSFGLDMPGPP